MIELRIGNLKLQKGSGDTTYHVVTPCEQEVKVGDPWGMVYTVALFERDKEGWDLRTVGKRPWEIGGVSGQEFMDFCRTAFMLLEKLPDE